MFRPPDVLSVEHLLPENLKLDVHSEIGALFLSKNVLAKIKKYTKHYIIDLSK